ncbi:MAG: beta-N-acetylhexosaminidase [Alphaproteobacteria bacterium]|nr:beta-N-acetylhexosaminidase [Alphaproteobacteria bacterium]
MSAVSSSVPERRRAARPPARRGGPKQVPRAVVFGCAGIALSGAEIAFFRVAQPLGFILFGRNVESPGQVAALVRALRAAVGRPEAPVLIDQEGGRVARLRPPHWPELPPARRFGEAWKRDPERAVEAVRANSQVLAGMLQPLGITVDCMPVLDVPVAGAHDVIGDRAYSDDPVAVAHLGLAAAQSLLEGGVLPVVKHMPGHGRATVDSHHDLPVVAASEEELTARDFAPFKALRYMPLGMTAHVRYTALDASRPATLSPTVVGEFIRDRIGFGGFLLTDDLSMAALPGTIGDRAEGALAAGCDAVLHCNGRLDEMEAIAAVVPPLDRHAIRRWAIADALLRRAAAPPIEVERAATWRDLMLAEA